MSAATLEEVLTKHWEFEWVDTDLWECACGYSLGNGTGDLDGRHRAHVAAAVRAWLAERLADEGLREAVARALAQMEPGEDWPANEALGGGPTGTRDDEYRWAMNEEATAALAAVTAALGVGEVEA